MYVCVSGCVGLCVCLGVWVCVCVYVHGGEDHILSLGERYQLEDNQFERSNV